ncbi:MAG: hypothetical protein IJP80_09230 [Bacteroidales bacterium]|nr:hypothetical protein [Bacteroidales bacterium]
MRQNTQTKKIPRPQGQARGRLHEVTAGKTRRTRRREAPGEIRRPAQGTPTAAQRLIFGLMGLPYQFQGKMHNVNATPKYD